MQFPNAQQFPAFNLTLNGMPLRIACGLKTSWDIGGAAVPFDCKKGYSPMGVVSSGESATVDAPPKVPFAIPGPGPDYICLEDNTAADNFCLLPLKYDSQGDKAFSIWKVDKLEIPIRFSLISLQILFIFLSLKLLYKY